jgi:glutamate decarboxylase
MQNCMENTAILREGIEATGRFEILSKEAGVPLVAFSLKDSGRYTVFDISEHLRRFGWIVPAYTMPANAEHVAVLRVVIREDFSRSLAERLVSDIVKILHELDAHSAQVLKISSAIAKQQSGDDGVVTKKSVLETEREIFAYWRDQVKKKQTGIC